MSSVTIPAKIGKTQSPELTTSQAMQNGMAELYRRRRAEGVDYGPSSPKPEHIATSPEPSTSPANPPPSAIKVFGSVVAAIQAAKQERIGQLWLLMRAADPAGRGRLAREAVYDLIDTSPANTRRIIRLGIEAGYFWQESDFLAYASEARVAVMLGVQFVTHHAVAIPVADLRTGSIVALRALFHDAFHSSRGDGFGNPIARGRNGRPGGVRAVTGRARATQRKYERRRGIGVQSNYEDLGKYTAANLAIAIDQGAAAFVVKMRGGARIVQRLSNAYDGTLATAKRSRRWLNRRIMQLAGGLRPGLCNQSCKDADVVKRYYQKPQQAARAAERTDLPLFARLWGFSARAGVLWRRVTDLTPFRAASSDFARQGKLKLVGV